MVFVTGVSGNGGPPASIVNTFTSSAVVKSPVRRIFTVVSNVTTGNPVDTTITASERGAQQATSGGVRPGRRGLGGVGANAQPLRHSVLRPGSFVQPLPRKEIGEIGSTDPRWSARCRYGTTRRARGT